MLAPPRAHRPRQFPPHRIRGQQLRHTHLPPTQRRASEHLPPPAIHDITVPRVLSHVHPLPTPTKRFTSGVQSAGATSRPFETTILEVTRMPLPVSLFSASAALHGRPSPGI
ncbi:hypothetical protein TRVL_07021 [Trypanosoma vivax]|nr:hypothetical protein TRVL_07021 [Trypanosoma vivax]